jgi:hypothetical protein
VRVRDCPNASTVFLFNHWYAAPIKYLNPTRMDPTKPSPAGAPYCCVSGLPHLHSTSRTSTILTLPRSSYYLNFLLYGTLTQFCGPEIPLHQGCSNTRGSYNFHFCLLHCICDGAFFACRLRCRLFTRVKQYLIPALHNDTCEYWVISPLK